MSLLFSTSLLKCHFFAFLTRFQQQKIKIKIIIIKSTCVNDYVLRVRNNTQARLIPAALLNRIYITYGSELYIKEYHSIWLMYNRHKYNYHYPHPISQDVKIQLLTNSSYPFMPTFTSIQSHIPSHTCTLSRPKCDHLQTKLYLLEPLLCLKHFLDQRLLEWLSY